MALVAGASGGLGAQFARTLGAAVTAVTLASRRIDKLQNVCAQIEAPGGAAPVVEPDVTGLASIRSGVAHTGTEVDSIDILVNNSSVSTPQRIRDVGEADYDFGFNTKAADDGFGACFWFQKK